jgi:hypothetical protein
MHRGLLPVTVCRRGCSRKVTGNRVRQEASQRHGVTPAQRREAGPAAPQGPGLPVGRRKTHERPPETIAAEGAAPLAPKARYDYSPHSPHKGCDLEAVFSHQETCKAADGCVIVKPSERQVALAHAGLMVQFWRYFARG